MDGKISLENLPFARATPLRFLMLFFDVHSFHQNLRELGKCAHHRAGFAAILARYHYHLVAFFYFHVRFCSRVRERYLPAPRLRQAGKILHPAPMPTGLHSQKTKTARVVNCAESDFSYWLALVLGSQKYSR